MLQKLGGPDLQPGRPCSDRGGRTRQALAAVPGILGAIRGDLSSIPQENRRKVANVFGAF